MCNFRPEYKEDKCNITLITSLCGINARLPVNNKNETKRNIF